MRLLPGKTVCTEIEIRAPLGISGGVGPVRHPVGAHAPGDNAPIIQRLLHKGLWTVTGQLALPERVGVERRSAGREQVLASSQGRLEAGVADPELLRADLRERPAAAAGVGVVRHAVAAHAVGVGDRRHGVR